METLVRSRRIVGLVTVAALVGCPTSPPTDHATIRDDGAVTVAPEVRSNGALPHIQLVSLSGRTFHGGDLVRIHVVTSTNVAVLEMRTFGYGRAFVKRDFGRFEGAFHVPALPSLLRVGYPIRFELIARNPSGGAVTDEATIDVR